MQQLSRYRNMLVTFTSYKLYAFVWHFNLAATCLTVRRLNNALSMKKFQTFFFRFFFFLHSISLYHSLYLSCKVFYVSCFVSKFVSKLSICVVHTQIRLHIDHKTYKGFIVCANKECSAGHWKCIENIDLK